MATLRPRPQNQPKRAAPAPVSRRRFNALVRALTVATAKAETLHAENVALSHALNTLRGERDAAHERAVAFERRLLTHAIPCPPEQASPSALECFRRWMWRTP
jgi:hypothetical protein